MSSSTTMSESDGLSSSSSSPLSSDGMNSSSSSVQLGGKGYRHKKGCKCASCKKRVRKYKKGGEMTQDIEHSINNVKLKINESTI
jgi:hypothetical protein